MMFRYSFDLGSSADLLEQAAKNVVAAGFRTGDIMAPGATKVSTTRMGDEILKELGKLAR
jgi:3-isopropylmalate dehydrogenase